MNWTPEQEQVIWARDRNLLVSAAAGSGKTAVLVERIIQMITDEAYPVDIDELLVMTFTKAAAAEMRERIGQAVERRLAQQPDNEHLQLQSALVHHAQITTIDSFCLNLIRNHFNMLEIDPAFRIGDEGELMLLRKDTMEQLLEEYYEKGDARFEQFVDTYAAGKADGGIEDYIMQVYNFAQSNPWPMLWIENCRKELRELENGHLEETAWMKFLMGDLNKQLGELCDQLEEAIEVCTEEGGPEVYLPTLEAELSMLRGLRDAGNYETFNSRLRAAVFGRLAAARSKEIDGEKKAYVTGCRDRIKKAVGGLKENYGFEDIGEAVSDLIGTGDVVEILLELASEFISRYQENKRDKNVVDFNDLEHYALDILVKHENGTIRYTEVADELSGQYREILVDEYQDSNYVQEELINSLSGERFGRPNVFMVGDVKQSIYRFRLARPELFMDKYETYTTTESKRQKIELHQNFRSRASVLASVNDVFYSVMTKNLGNIQYTEDTALHPGAIFAPVTGETEAGGTEDIASLCTSEAACGQIEMKFEVQTEVQAETHTEKQTGVQSGTQTGAQIKVQTTVQPGAENESDILSAAELGNSAANSALSPAERIGTPTELLLVNTGKDSSRQADEEMADYTSKEVEAKLIARRIRELTDEETGLLIWDKEEQCYRTARYQDMVILLRSVSGWTDSFLNVLTQEGIPAFADTGTGYFDTIEVETVLAILAVIDNPMQDIPLAAAFKSPVVNLTDEELACITSAYRKHPDKGQDRGLYGAWKYCMSTDTGAPAMLQKLRAFDTFLTGMRDEAAYLPIHEVIYRVYVKTGYYDYVSAMPAGETRRANLDMLVEKASAYENTSYKGLFHFIRYIGNLKKYDTDFGEASAPGDGDNMVRLMSIHKSKGLEFPIVFLAGLGKSFNKQDVRGKILIDADLGIGTDYFNQDLRLKSTTLKKNVLKRKMDLDSLGEELRVLYVAMTRAKEKLIMTGTDRYLDKKQEKWSQIPPDQNAIPYTILTAAGSCLDWLLMSLPRAEKTIITKEIPLEELVGEEVIRQVKKQVSKEELLQMDLTTPKNQACLDTLQSVLAYRYPHKADIMLNTKMSVSELKKLGQDADDWDSLYQPVIPEFLRPNQDMAAARKKPEERPEEENQMPGSDWPSARPPKDWTSKTGQNYGASRGTAYHRALELLDLASIETKEDLTANVTFILESKKMEEADHRMLDTDILWRFFTSPLGQRMKTAHQNGFLHREQQFVMGIPASEMGFADSEELVLVQGIIDAYLEEPSGLVLIDYKTDRISPGQEDYLVKRYKSQLDYYQRALEQITGKHVSQRLIYSITLQKEITV